MTRQPAARSRARALALIPSVLAAVQMLGCSGVIGGGAPDDGTNAGASTNGGVATSAGTTASTGTAGTTGTAATAGTTSTTGAGTASTASTAGTAGSTGTVGTTGTTADICAANAGTLKMGRTLLRRMTHSQFNNTVRDLLGVTGSPATPISPDERVGPFFNNAIVPITDLLVQQHAEVAASVATQAVARMSQIAPCDLAADNGTTCATQFIADFGRKAYRRPLDATESAQYLALYTLERGQGTAQTAFGLIVETMLQSPFFLYHVDVGPGGMPSGTPVRLGSYELASRLSYFLWDSMPDQTLFDLAANDMLQGDTVLSAQVDRMLADPRAADAVPSFHLQWLGIDDIGGVDKDAARFPQWNAALASAMSSETAAFTDFVVRRGDGLMSTLFTAGFSFPQGGLFQLYGLTQPGGFQPGAQVATNTAQRAGILTQASVLAVHAHRDQTSPVHRGILVRENILCQPLGSPPADVNTSPPAVSDATTTRQRFAAHEADPRCASCHTLIDPIGLAFENYDPVGAYRTTDGQGTVDASGEIIGGQNNLAGPFVGALELSQRLATSREVGDCLSNQWFRFALGRMESNDDACSLQATHEAFAASGGNIRQLLAKIATSDAFRYVRATGANQ